MISVVIPVLNESRTITACLMRIKAEAADHEIVVVDGGSRDDTMDRVSTFFPDVVQIVSPRGRARQMNRGAAAAQGDILLFLHADTLLPTGGLDRIEALFSRHEDIAAGSFSLRFDHKSPLLNLYARFSRINHVLFTYGDQGLFMPRCVFRRIGGFREMPIMEDVEIQNRLRRMGRFVKLRVPVTTSARRFLRHGIVRQQVLNAGLVFLYHLGVPPSRLKRFYGYPS